MEGVMEWMAAHEGQAAAMLAVGSFIYGFMGAWGAALYQRATRKVGA